MLNHYRAKTSIIFLILFNLSLTPRGYAERLSNQIKVQMMDNLSDKPKAFVVRHFAGVKPLHYWDEEPRLILSEDPELESNHKKVLILIHGTWAAHFPILKDGWTNLNRPFLKKLITERGGIGATFQWQGGNNKTSRYQAAQVLSDHLKKLYHAGYQVDIIAHSHGGNVAKLAVTLAHQDLIKQDIHNPTLVNGMVGLAVPVRQDYHYPEEAISNHLQIYSPFDATQICGGELAGKVLAKRKDPQAKNISTAKINKDGIGPWTTHNGLFQDSVLSYSQQFLKSPKP